MEDWNTGILEYWKNVGINIFSVESFFTLKKQMDLRNLKLFKFRDIMSFIKPKKRLGQHFLTDNNIARKIANSLQVQDVQSLVEVGAGTGILTQFLPKRYKNKIWLVEIDNEAVQILREKFPEMNECILEKNILKLNLGNEFSGNISLIGNFPYNISSQIFFKVLESKDQIKEVVCMVQKEVAERIRSGPGTKKYGILSVLLQAYYHIEILFTVNENVFFPPPKVKSSVMRLTRNNRDHLACDEQLFLRIVKTGFNQRRKTLRNSLKNGLFNKKTDEALMSKRPEELGVEEFITLTNFISNNL